MVGRNAGMWSHGIVAAVDDSASAGKVIAVSIAIAAQCDLPLRLIHVGVSTAGASEILRRGGERADAAGLDCAVETVAGRLPDAVIAAQKRCAADLLVVGFRSDGAVERAVLGSNARKLIGVAETPVLIVKP
jgi:nucleotide-binding universal stress UspA family protein